MSPTIDDAHLLTAWQHQHDTEAFRVLCDRHICLVESACRRQGSPDVSEAVQAVFLVLARRAGSVSGASLGGWLTTTVIRVVGHQHRAAASRRRHEQEAAMEQARQRAADGADPTWEEARHHLDAALASLSTGRREAILRFYLAGRPQAEVAAELGCSVAAVKMRVHEGLEGLRKFLARKGIALGAVALASGLASEATASDPTLVATCVQTVLTPAAAPSAAALAHGVTTAMLIKTVTLVAAASAAILLPVTAVGVLLASEVAPAPPLPVVLAAVQVVTPTPVPPTPFTKELDGELSVDFQNVDFVEAIMFIQRTTHINIVVDPAVLKRGPEPITLKADKMRAKNVLGFIERFSGLDHRVENEAYVIFPAGQSKPVPVPRIDLLHIDQCPGLADRLAQRVTFDFQDVDIAEVIQFISQITGTNVLETPSFRKRSAKNSVTLKVENMRFDMVLEWICTLTDTTVSAQSQALVFDVVPEAGLMPAPAQSEPAAPSSSF